MGVKMVGYVSRYIEHPVIEDLKHKMVFIGGPRQTGKTTLAKHLCEEKPLFHSIHFIIQYHKVI
jgi:predicted AAA+ superfamily ATPase